MLDVSWRRSMSPGQTAIYNGEYRLVVRGNPNKIGQNSSRSSGVLYCYLGAFSQAFCRGKPGFGHKPVRHVTAFNLSATQPSMVALHAHHLNIFRLLAVV